MIDFCIVHKQLILEGLHTYIIGNKHVFYSHTQNPKVGVLTWVRMRATHFTHSHNDLLTLLRKGTKIVLSRCLLV